MEFLNQYVFTDYNLEVLIQLIVAIICGGIVGLERSEHHQFAGLRTHVIVCVGAASVMIAGIFTSTQLGLSTDVTRMGAQVVSGIGFLGAGAILSSTEKSKIKGLTTAAGLWTTACIGLLVGVKAYVPAIITTLILLVANLFLKPLSNYFVKKGYKAVISINYVRGVDTNRMVDAIFAAGARGVKISEISQELYSENCKVNFSANILPDFSYEKFSEEISKIEGIQKFSVSFRNKSLEI